MVRLHGGTFSSNFLQFYQATWKFSQRTRGVFYRFYQMNASVIWPRRNACPLFPRHTGHGTPTTKATRFNVTFARANCWVYESTRRIARAETKGGMRGANKSSAPFIFVRALEDLQRENRRSANWPWSYLFKSTLSQELYFVSGCCMIGHITRCLTSWTTRKHHTDPSH